MLAKLVNLTIVVFLIGFLCYAHVVKILRDHIFLERLNASKSQRILPP